MHQRFCTLWHTVVPPHQQGNIIHSWNVSACVLEKSNTIIIRCCLCPRFAHCRAWCCTCTLPVEKSDQLEIETDSRDGRCPSVWIEPDSNCLGTWWVSNCRLIGLTHLWASHNPLLPLVTVWKWSELGQREMTHCVFVKWHLSSWSHDTERKWMMVCFHQMLKSSGTPLSIRLWEHITQHSNCTMSTDSWMDNWWQNVKHKQKRSLISSPLAGCSFWHLFCSMRIPSLIIFRTSPTIFIGWNYSPTVMFF